MKFAAQRKSASLPQRDRRYIDALATEVRKILLDQAIESFRHGGSLTDMGPVEKVAERIDLAMPRISTWSDVIGPVYSTGQLTRLLSVSRQALGDRVRRQTLLSLRTADGQLVYPAFQFDEHHKVLSGLSEVLRCFDRSTVDDWTLAGWLVAEQETLEGLSVVEALRRGDLGGRVVAAARRQAERFAR